MNFVCLVFELGDKTLTLSPMENLMVKCNQHSYYMTLSTGKQRRHIINAREDTTYMYHFFVFYSVLLNFRLRP